VATTPRTSAKNFSDKPVLSGEKVLLRPFAADDLPVLTSFLDGEEVVHDWDEHNRSCNFRTLIAAPGRGRGLGTEATRLVVGHGFEHVGLHRISLGVHAFNPRARRVYEWAALARSAGGPP
jgi:hypothetical protein